MTNETVTLNQNKSLSKTFCGGQHPAGNTKSNDKLFVHFTSETHWLRSIVVGIQSTFIQKSQSPQPKPSQEVALNWDTSSDRHESVVADLPFVPCRDGPHAHHQLATV